MLRRAQRIGRPLDEVFAFFSDARNLELITPPWLSFSLLGEPPDPLAEGSLISYRLRLHGVPLRWISRIEQWQPGRSFIDTQLRGPYRLWRHLHEFEADGQSTLIRDEVRYALPLGLAGALAHLAFVRRDLARIFDYRQQATARLLG